MFRIKNKKLFKYFLVLILILLISLLVFLYFKNKTNLKNKNIIINTSPQNISKNIKATPEFLSDKEKKNFGISPDFKVQALKRNSRGEVMIYKIIKDNDDIVHKPSALQTIQPSKPKLSK